MYGKGLLTGLGITLKHFFGKAVTEQYPEQRPKLSQRFQGFLALDAEKCTACGICANSCPNGVITGSSERDENKKRYLTGYKVELEYCLFCGLCVEACPQEALSWTQEFEHACYHREDTVYKLYELTASREAVAASNS